MKKTLIILSLLLLAGLVFAQQEIYYENFGIYDIEAGDYPYYGSLKDFPSYSGPSRQPHVNYSGTAGIWDYEPDTPDKYTGYSGPYHIQLFTQGITLYVKGINTSTYENIKLSFGLHRKLIETTPAAFSVQVCDGSDNPQNPVWNTIWNTIGGINHVPETDDWLGWKYIEISGANIPATDNLWLKFTSLDGTQYLLDDIMLCGDESGPKPVKNVTQGTFYATIQAAIDAAEDGNVIVVSDGTYEENLTVNKNISLKSENGAELTIIDGLQTGPELGTIQLIPGRNGVIIGEIDHGFTIKGIDGPKGVEKAAIYLRGAQTNISIEGNVIEARGDAALMGEYNAGLTNITINANTITGQTFIGDNPAGIGFGAQYGLDNVPRQLVVFGGGAGTSNTQNFTFTNNTLSGICGGMSITDNNGNPIDSTPQGNTIASLEFAGENNVITGNTFSGTTVRYAEALRMRGPGNYEISGNTFNGSYPVIMTAQTTDISIGLNRIQTALQDNSFEKYVVVNSGRALAVPSIFPTIQAGVAAADDGEVVQASGDTFLEDVIINKAITLRGAQSRDGLPVIQGTGVGSVVTIAADNVTLTGFQIQNSGLEPLDAGVLIYERTGCQIIGNTILDNANGIAVALGSGNTIQGNTINNNNYYGIGITASNENTIEANDIFANGLDAIGLDNANIIDGSYDDGASRNLIKNNMIKSNRDGIFLGLNCNEETIEGNTISDVDQIGIHLWWSDENTIKDNSISTSWAGIRVRGASENDITANTITANEIGILVEPSQAGDDQLPSENNTFKQNMIFGNTEYGATANHTNQLQYGDVDMLENWWGDVTGPYHASTNPNGLGNAVTDNILFDPWTGQILGAELYVEAPKTLIQADEEQTYSVKILSVENFRGYQMVVKIPKADFQETTNVAPGPLFVEDPFFMAKSIEDDYYWIYDVTSANMGAVEAIEGDNIVLFTFEATSKADYDNTPNGCWIEVPLSEVRLKTMMNQIIPCLEVTNLNIIIDGTDPEAVINNEDEYESPYLLGINPDGSGELVLPELEIECTDNYLFGYAQYIILPADADAPEFGDFVNNLFDLEDNETTDTWQLDTDVNNLDDGEYTVYILVVDAAGNYTIIDWSFIKDATPPGPIVWDSEIPCRTTEKQDNFIDLKWVNPEDAVENHIWVLSYGALPGANAYPTYGPADNYDIPTAPNPYDASPQNGWVRQAIYDPLDLEAEMPYALEFEERGYYYITIFAKDASGNFSTVPDDPFYRESISYWPGDVVGTPDGLAHTVDSDDMAQLSAAWGLTSDDDNWNANIDVGPTVDRGRRTRPTPDGVIDIEDLMIFAMNYNNTVYTFYNRGEDNATPINIEPMISYENDLMRVDFVISENSGFLRGLNIPFGFGSGLDLQNVELGEIWPENSVVFHTNEDNMLTLSASTLGEAALAENGVFLTVKFRVSGNDVSTELFHMLARDLNNEEVEILNNPDTNPTSADEHVIVIPDTSYLGSNYPNPFNPSTTIQYGLKQAGNVKIGVYNSRGQLVRTLVSEAKAAGTYTAVWNGLDNYGRAVSSGIYFFRMDTADKTQVQKALLMK